MSDEQVLKEVFGSILEKLITSGIGVEITNNKIDLQIPVKVSNGGTGTDTLNGYVKGDGSAPLVATLTIPVADIEGVLPVSKGGTGMWELKGYLFGNGDALVNKTQIPAADIAGLGSMASQDSKNVSISGGSIAGSAIDGDIAGNANGLNSILPVEKGGTGFASLDALKKTLNCASSGANKDITSINGLLTPLSVAQGGTGLSYGSGYLKAISGVYASVEKIDGSEIKGDINGNADNVTGVVGVANGGTGAASLNGYVIGTGTNALSAISKINGSDIQGDIAGNAANVNGVVGMAQGGTGLSSAKGYLCGDGTGYQAKAKVAFDDVDGLGTLAKQAADAVQISGGEAAFDKISINNLSFFGKTHTTYTMTSNMPLMNPAGFVEVMIGNKVCKVPYYEY